MSEKKKNCSGNLLDPDPVASPSDKMSTMQQKPVASMAYAALFEQTALGIVYIDAAGRWLYLNQKFCDIVGYTPEELRHQACKNIIFPDDLTHNTDIFKHGYTPAHQSATVRLRCVRKDTLLVWIKLTLTSIDHVAEQDAYLIGFVEDISAQKQLALQVELERHEAQSRVVALHEEKRRLEDFLGLATHELRTPLTTIKANTQLALRRLKHTLQHPTTLLDDSEKKIEAASSMLERVERQISVLNRLVGDMLDVSRIQSGRLQMYMSQESHNLLSIVEAVVQEQQKATPERNISIHFPARDQIEICGDAERIGQVISHYLMNALKYSETSQPVSVELLVEQQGSEQRIARVKVQDKGQGLALEEQQRVWECFYQVPGVKVLSGSGVGLGIGLYISRSLIERHGGSVGIDSQPGIGSTFWFTLPLA